MIERFEQEKIIYKNKQIIKEWGGYLPLECTISYNSNDSIFAGIEERNIVRLNSARNAICLVMKSGMYQKIWIPLYMCISIKETLERNDIQYEFYSIDKHFEPMLDSIPEQDIILVCNYFGLKREDYYTNCVTKYHNVIFDNTQALFHKPMLFNDVYNVYSPRKFVGVSDGAFLIGKGIDIQNGFLSREVAELRSDFSFQRANYLLKSVELSTNEAYEDYLESETQLDDIRLMSPLTLMLLNCINYSEIESIRIKNCHTLNMCLKKYNELSIEDLGVAPMCYPFLVEDDELRAKIVQSRIYVPQWWKWVINELRANDWEIKVSKWLLPIPIDQRYSEDDMRELADRIIRFMN